MIDTYLRSAIPKGVKGDGTALLYDCPHCRSVGRLEVTTDRRPALWFCHKCARGGRVGDGLRSRLSALRCNRDTSSGGSGGILPPTQYLPVSPGTLQYEYLLARRRLPLDRISTLRPCVNGADVRYVHFPIYDLGNPTPIYYFGRALEDGTQPRYYNAPRRLFPQSHSGMLWGLHRRRRGESNVTICEGIFDAVWADDRVATLGKSVGRAKVRTLAGLRPDRFTIMFDGAAGQSAKVLALELARTCPSEIYIAHLPPGSDPDDLGDEGESYIQDAERFA